jgi:uncharacterized membrane protein (DUF2068 family)
LVGRHLGVGSKHREGPPLEGRKVRRWDPETLVCAFRGHDAPAVEARVWPPESVIAVECGEGRFARCLRCDAWIPVDPAWAVVDELPPLESIRLPARGKTLRDALVLKAIAVDRAIHAVVFATVAVVVLLIETHLGPLQHRAREILDATRRGIAGTGQGASHGFFVRELDKFVHLKRGGLQLVLVTACVYAVLEGVEAVGLWRERRWAEYLTAVATAGFLPFELHELSVRVTVGRVIALVVNVAVLVYLLWAKHLFGIGGGEREEEAELAAAEALPPLPWARPEASSSPR